MPFSDFGVFLGDLSLWHINKSTKHPMKDQRKTLSKIIRRNKNTELGKKLGLSDIHSIEDYQQKVPLSTYADYEPYVEYMLSHKGENPMFKGRNVRYCSSSGSVVGGVVSLGVLVLALMAILEFGLTNVVIVLAILVVLYTLGNLIKKGPDISVWNIGKGLLCGFATFVAVYLLSLIHI